MVLSYQPPPPQEDKLPPSEALSMTRYPLARVAGRMARVAHLGPVHAGSQRQVDAAVHTPLSAQSMSVLHEEEDEEGSSSEAGEEGGEGGASFT